MGVILTLKVSKVKDETFILTLPQDIVEKLWIKEGDLVEISIERLDLTDVTRTITKKEEG